MSESVLGKIGTRWEMTGVGEPLVRAEFELPEPGPGEVLIAVEGCGVCHSDLSFLFDGVPLRSPLPLALGHEISGIVVAAGEGATDYLRRAVIVPAVIPCGVCELCLDGHGSICATQIMPGNDVAGAFGSHVLVPAYGLCPVDVEGALDGGTLGESGCTLAELSVVADALTTPYQAVHRADVAAGDVVCVVGLGGVGGYAAQVAAARGATVIGFDVDTDRLALMRQHGLTAGIDPREGSARDMRDRVKALAKEHGLPSTRWKIFECSGTAAGQELAWGLLVHGATLSVVGYTMDKISVRLSNLMAFDAKAVGNWGCLPELYPEALDLVLTGKVAVKPFVETHPMEDIQAIVEAAHERRLNRRAVLTP